MLMITELANGNLSVKATDNGVELIENYIKSEPYNMIWCDLLESHSSNGSYSYFDSETRMTNPLALTGAPCIAESMHYDDDGEATAEGKNWYLADYATFDEMRALMHGEEVIFNLIEQE
jgi:hypothetical protein